MNVSTLERTVTNNTKSVSKVMNTLTRRKRKERIPVKWEELNDFIKNNKNKIDAFEFSYTNSY